jgi:hypothetical protein
MADHHRLWQILVVPEFVADPPEVELPRLIIRVVCEPVEEGGYLAGRLDYESADVHLLRLRVNSRL